MASAIADELSAGAVENTMTKEMMLPSIIMYITAQKYMDLNDCNGFTIPCPDACSTRRMNAEKFTPWLTHALNMEQGIPSACEYDTNAVLSQQALIAVSGKNPYMGNTVPIPCVDGHFQTRFANTPEQFAELEKDPANLGHLYMMQHSVAHRRLRGSDKNAEYSIRNFTYDQGFGVTIRYDFDADAGQKITFCRFAPDGSKLFVGTGEIVMGGGYKSQNCTQLVYFRVKDTADTWEKQCYAGNHCAMVYGDYTKELIALANVRLLYCRLNSLPHSLCVVPIVGANEPHRLHNFNTVGNILFQAGHKCSKPFFICKSIETRFQFSACTKAARAFIVVQVLRTNQHGQYFQFNIFCFFNHVNTSFLIFQCLSQNQYSILFL
ncbi:MAG: hypothetical protein LUD55_08320 [Oscillospiraceae bacterium]|nr:hypothetical protein [Oscillospiraceae bacterium]